MLQQLRQRPLQALLELGLEAIDLSWAERLAELLAVGGIRCKPTGEQSLVNR
ncbi:MAG: hypothetical protein ACO3SX_10120 [Vulcanococcus sp.]|jgi:hypothetical protein